MNIKLPYGKAVVITGPEGSGKTTLAKFFAEILGNCKLTEGRRVFDNGPFGLSEILADEPGTVIVDDVEFTKENICRARVSVSEDVVEVERRGEDPRFVKLPNFIFCTGSIDAISHELHDRRFFAIMPVKDDG